MTTIINIGCVAIAAFAVCNVNKLCEEAYNKGHEDGYKEGLYVNVINMSSKD